MPLFLSVSAADVDAVTEHRDEFLKLGVDAEPAGETSLRVSALPGRCGRRGGRSLYPGYPDPS